MRGGRRILCVYGHGADDSRHGHRVPGVHVLPRDVVGDAIDDAVRDVVRDGHGDALGHADAHANANAYNLSIAVVLARFSLV